MNTLSTLTDRIFVLLLFVLMLPKLLLATFTQSNSFITVHMFRNESEGGFYF